MNVTTLPLPHFFCSYIGRIVLINTTLKSLKLTLCNIYAPNGQSEQLEFIQELNWCLIDKSELTTLIVGGDWNCSLSKKDKTGGAPWKATNYRNLILTTMEMLDLVDIQRSKYPKLRKYSYESKSLGVKSRIDFFLIAKNLEKYVKTCAIVPAIAPDHKAVQISLSWPKETSRGPGFWKFNNTLLTDESYVNTVRSVYAQTCELRSQIEDKRLFWELLKMEIRAATITFAKRKAQMNHNKENEIKRQLDELDNLICNNFQHPDINNILEKYSKLKKDFELIYEQKGKAAMFRSKCRWLENGERPTKYFFNLEKRNHNKKIVTELITENESAIKDENLILDKIESFFKDLYTSNISFSETKYNGFIENLNMPRLSEDDREKCEGLLTYEECKKSLETFQNEKSPGEDGFTVEFYKCFFELLGTDLVASLNAAYELGELSISQRRGVITLLPKEDGPLSALSNWRPITLLNTDYKIASKAIAKRLETVLSSLVHTDQTGFIKERYIGENIRLINDVMEHTRIEKKGGILISLDFNKAFDSLEWPLITKVLNTFNFGTSLRKWVTVFYSNIESAVINNGFATNWFKLSKGVRQGCPLSPYLLYCLRKSCLTKFARVEISRE